MKRTVCLTHDHEHESVKDRAARILRLAGLLHECPDKRLTGQRLRGLLPPRGPSGCWQNLERGKVIRALNRAGYTIDGKRVR